MKLKMINLEYLKTAKEKTESGPWHYLVGGAEEEISLRRNRLVYQNWGLKPFSCRDVSGVDLSTDFLGFKMRAPIFASPIGSLTLFHKDGEIEWAKGVKGANLYGALSGVTRMEPKDVIEQSHANLFLQLYAYGDWTWISRYVESNIDRGYKAVVVTTDTTWPAIRDRDEIIDYNARFDGFRAAAPPPDHEKSKCLNWDIVEKLVELVDVPVILKGIMNTADVKKAKQLGVKAIWISNHGGRQLSHACATLELLEELAPICKQYELPIVFDGGVRRGSEALIALLLGADLIALGRLAIFGLIVDGAKGVTSVFDNFEKELTANMGMCGLRSIKELHDNRSNCLQKLNSESAPLLTRWDAIEQSFEY